MADLFAGRWARKERELGLATIVSDWIACGSDVLPESAAPCVSFDEAAQPVPIWEAFGAPSDWSPADRERLARYRLIGSDGAGNPICVDQTTKAVVLLDHEDWFHTCQFVNSSVRNLAECLLCYMGEQQAERFRSSVQAIDPTAIAEGSFWWCEAACLGADNSPAV